MAVINRTDTEVGRPLGGYAGQNLAKATSSTLHRPFIREMVLRLQEGVGPARGTSSAGCGG